MKKSRKQNRRSLERLVRRWKREAIELRKETADANLRCTLMERRMRAAHASAIQLRNDWLATQPQGLQDIIDNIRWNTMEPNADSTTPVRI
jgi:hypothetical protein